MITFVKGLVSPYVVLLVEVFLHLVLVLELLLVLQFSLMLLASVCCADFCLSSSPIIITSFAVSASAESPVSIPIYIKLSTLSDSTLEEIGVLCATGLPEMTSSVVVRIKTHAFLIYFLLLKNNKS